MEQPAAKLEFGRLLNEIASTGGITHLPQQRLGNGSVNIHFVP
jgi:hypothetical protein